MKWYEMQLAWSFAFEAQTILISKHPFFSSLFLLKGLGFWLGRLVFEYIEIWDLEKIQNVCVLVFLCGWMFAGKAFILVKVVQNSKWAIWLWNWVIVLEKKKNVEQTCWVASKIWNWFITGKSYELPYLLLKAFNIVFQIFEKVYIIGIFSPQ